MTFLSPAKLNLGLKIVGKRTDGYHLLKTIFCLIDLFDEIQIQTTNNGKISLIEHNQVWPYQTDLTYKAAKLLQEESGTKYGANIKVNKTIPSGGGLGGGSSNAATILKVLNDLWQLGMTSSELIQLGARLGADVPFFIHGKNAIAEGIGDVFTDIELPQQYFVLICPKFHINTAKVFQNYRHCEEDFYKNLAGIQSLDPSFHGDDVNYYNYLLETLENDLFPIALKLKPELASILKQLDIFGKVAMTGSGSSLFLRFYEREEAKKVAKRIAEISQNKYNTFLVKSLDFSPIFSNL
ncbi:MAG TPA: 4-(cytidine 5'-diphospho)-2-C-methyl-D-erythritol kinase [Aquella sp.]|nr:4-(cytidine 5'-diphospho)-2-C-methyl-D-erythritol kinase [Aquella sp.]